MECVRLWIIRPKLLFHIAKKCIGPENHLINRMHNKRNLINKPVWYGWRRTSSQRLFQWIILMDHFNMFINFEIKLEKVTNLPFE